jgi:hypothetical protein
MIAAYRQMTIEEAELTDASDLEIQMEAELWCLEQEEALVRTHHRPTRAA